MNTINSTETAMLILQRGGTEAGRRWLLDKQSLTIGRADDCDIVLPDRVVSRHHARVYWIDGDYYVEDLGSKNGTYVNGKEVTEAQQLEDGDEIQIALRFKLAFVDAGATAPLTLEEDIEPGLRLEPATRQVFVRGRELTPPLSVAQYRLLELLINAQGGVVTREEVVRAVWPEAVEEGVSEQAIDALVRRLRERIAELDPEHQYIVTVRGHGFRLENRE
ncbi:MAG: FHA domain-containing protein [Chloroflexi bacterium]|nr:FHA domain-containing protein [Chloroflexota bacterium]